MNPHQRKQPSSEIRARLVYMIFGMSLMVWTIGFADDFPEPTDPFWHAVYWVVVFIVGAVIPLLIIFDSVSLFDDDGVTSKGGQ